MCQRILKAGVVCVCLNCIQLIIINEVSLKLNYNYELVFSICHKIKLSYSSTITVICKNIYFISAKRSKLRTKSFVLLMKTNIFLHEVKFFPIRNLAVFSPEVKQVHRSHYRIQRNTSSCFKFLVLYPGHPKSERFFERRFCL